MDKQQKLSLVPDAAMVVAEIEAVSQQKKSRRNMVTALLHTRLGKVLGLACLTALFLGCGTWLSGHAMKSAGSAHGQSAPKPSSSGQSAFAADEEDDSIKVDVHGDVVHPGVVTLKENARVGDAVRAAGGFVHKADAENVNMAAMVWDGEEVDVGSAAGNAQSENGSNAADTGAMVSDGDAPTGGGQRINLNSADAETLETLPDVGPTRAAEILAYRKAHGPFQTVADLTNVKGIGDKTLAKWTGILFVPQANADKP
jgi:competence protein ComEA